ncbi:hypothetical protein GJV85_09605 [Sulfurimonas aquatica]|uniref:Uncharacterized protein n=1 Tax=Sulfurimonas aquatica TaxID=2672570 RepID=A0A975B164_9BACT|nr:hypothetical protein [Sulfurimonas aquatica]QSZ42349.1 hypothetical protein GJV85_09605 [Sulfurimonas aquatica]
MSFREYLELMLDIELPIIKLEDILKSHEDIIFDITAKLEKLDVRVIPLFKRYLKVGYYPYSLDIDDDDVFIDTLKQNIHISISYDLLSVYPSLDGNSIKK